MDYRNSVYRSFIEYRSLPFIPDSTKSLIRHKTVLSKISNTLFASQLQRDVQITQRGIKQDNQKQMLFKDLRLLKVQRKNTNFDKGIEWSVELPYRILFEYVRPNVQADKSLRAIYFSDLQDANNFKLLLWSKINSAKMINFVRKSQGQSLISTSRRFIFTIKQLKEHIQTEQYKNRELEQIKREREQQAQKALHLQRQRIQQLEAFTIKVKELQLTLQENQTRKKEQITKKLLEFVRKKQPDPFLKVDIDKIQLNKKRPKDQEVIFSAFYKSQLANQLVFRDNLFAKNGQIAIGHVMHIPDYKDNDIISLSLETKSKDIQYIGQLSLFDMASNNIAGRKHILPLMSKHEVKDKDPTAQIYSVMVPNPTQEQSFGACRKSMVEKGLKEKTAYGQEKDVKINPQHINLFAELYDLQNFKKVDPFQLKKHQIHAFHQQLFNKTDTQNLSALAKENKSFQKTVAVLQKLKELNRQHVFIHNSIPITINKDRIENQLNQLCGIGLHRDFRIDFWEGMLQTTSLKKEYQDIFKLYFKFGHDQHFDIMLIIADQVSKIDPVLMQNLCADLHRFHLLKHLSPQRSKRLQKLMHLYLSLLTVVKAEFCFIYSSSLLHIAQAILVGVQSHILRQSGAPDRKSQQNYIKFNNEITIRSFWLLMGIVSRVVPDLYRAEKSRGFYLNKQRLQGFRRYSAILKLLAKNNSAQINFKLNKIGTGTEMYMSSAILTLFADRLNYDSLFRVWDILICKSLYENLDHYLPVACFHMLLHLQPCLVEAKSRPEFEELARIQLALMNSDQFVSTLIQSFRKYAILSDITYQLNYRNSAFYELFSDEESQHQAVSTFLNQVKYDPQVAFVFAVRRRQDYSAKLFDQDELRTVQTSSVNKKQTSIFQSEMQVSRVLLMVLNIEGTTEMSQIRVIVDEKPYQEISPYDIYKKQIQIPASSRTFSFHLVSRSNFTSSTVQVRNYRLDALLRDSLTLSTGQKDELGVIHFSIIVQSNFKKIKRSKPQDRSVLLRKLSDYPSTDIIERGLSNFVQLFQRARAELDSKRLIIPSAEACNPDWVQLAQIPLPKVKQLFSDNFQRLGKKQFKLCWSMVFKQFSQKNQFNLFDFAKFVIVVILHSRMTSNDKLTALYSFITARVPMTVFNANSVIAFLNDCYIIFNQNHAISQAFIQLCTANGGIDGSEILQSLTTINHQLKSTRDVLMHTCLLNDINLKEQITGQNSFNSQLRSFSFSPKNQLKILSSLKERRQKMSEKQKQQSLLKAILGLGQLVLQLEDHHSVLSYQQFIDQCRKSSALLYYEQFESTLLCLNRPTEYRFDDSLSTLRVLFKLGSQTLHCQQYSFSQGLKPQLSKALDKTISLHLPINFIIQAFQPMILSDNLNLQNLTRIHQVQHLITGPQLLYSRSDCLCHVLSSQQPRKSAELQIRFVAVANSLNEFGEQFMRVRQPADKVKFMRCKQEGNLLWIQGRDKQLRLQQQHQLI